MRPSLLWTKVHVRAARYMFRRPFPIRTQTAFISFTFDDFPRSALLTGGAILKRLGVTGTYYASFGLMGKQAPTGTMFLPEDVHALLEQGHELGCHTFGHHDAWKTNTRTFEESILENRKALSRLVPGAAFRTFAYPINVPRARTKRRVAEYFKCARAGGQTFNSGTADLNYLHAYFLEKSRDNPAVVERVIEQTRRARGWMVFATHDICDKPTPWGCTPEFFEEVVETAVRSGARVLPVVQALEALDASSPPHLFATCKTMG